MEYSYLNQKAMTTIIKTKLNLDCEEYNYRQLAKIRERVQKELQPCDDERFLPARVNHELLGDVLAAKHERIMISQGKKVKDFNRSRGLKMPEEKIENIYDLFLLIYKKTTKAIWKIMKKK